MLDQYISNQADDPVQPEYFKPFTKRVGIILYMGSPGSANERPRYNVTSSLTGWAHTQIDPWIVKS